MQEYEATYSPEDNKLRLYALARLDNDTYKRVRAAGFRWAPKQELFVAPSWSPAREDLLLELCGDIGDEDYSPEDRAADRAERFSDYRDKRRREAGAHADAFDAGPGVYGHQNRARAERAAARHDRQRGYAVTQWSKAEYWQIRTAAVIDHALYKARPDVRRRRILKLQAEQRKAQATLDKVQGVWDGWAAFRDRDDSPELTAEVIKYAGRVPSGFGWREYPHPDSAEQCHDVYTLLCIGDREHCDVRSITGAEAVQLFFGEQPERPGSDPTSYFMRWLAHYSLRLGYESAMLENEGGAAFNDVIEPGHVTTGGRFQVTKVNKSAADGRVVSVSVVDTETWEAANAVNVESMEAGQFIEPTDEQRAAFKAWQAEQRAKTKAANAKKPKLINPTPEDAAKLQTLAFNAQYKDKKHHAETIDSTQKAYSAHAKGNYGKCETVVIGEKLRPLEKTWRRRGQRCELFKVRIFSNGWDADRVVIITDKPQKPIPWHLVDAALATCPNEENTALAFVKLLAKRGQWGYEFGDLPDDEREAARQLRQDAAYLGWATIECANEFRITEAGRAILDKWRPVVEAETTAAPQTQTTLFNCEASQ